MILKLTQKYYIIIMKNHHNCHVRPIRFIFYILVILRYSKWMRVNYAHLTWKILTFFLRRHLTDIITGMIFINQMPRPIRSDKRRIIFQIIFRIRVPILKGRIFPWGRFFVSPPIDNPFSFVFGIINSQPVGGFLIPSYQNGMSVENLFKNLKKFCSFFHRPIYVFAI